MEQKEYRRYRAVACPELKSVRRLCVLIIIACCGLLYLCIKNPWLWDFGNTPAAWIIAGVIALFVAFKAFRAFVIQSYWSKYPWEQEGCEWL